MISVVVRSHNDAGVIRRTLEALTTQDCPDFEILSFDDSSTDGTLEIIRSFPGVRVFPPDGLPYNPARVLNRAVAECSGDIVVFNNSDAVPLSSDYLRKLVAPLSSPAVGAVFGNQLCRSNADVLVRKDYERAFGDGAVSASWRHFFSLVSSAARRETLVANPFDPAMQYSEDVEWSWRLKRSGLGIVYVPGAAVEHSHNYTLREVSRRFYSEGLADGVIFGGARGFSGFLLSLGVELLRDMAYIFRNGRLCDLPRGVCYRIVQRFEFWRGARRGAARECKK